MGSWRFRCCPKCGGDMHLGDDPKDGWQEECLQCGYCINRNGKVIVQEMVERRFKEVKA